MAHDKWSTVHRLGHLIWFILFFEVPLQWSFVFNLCFLSAVTWTVTCTYSQTLASKNPKCCVSLSSFYNPMITPCPSCSCGCGNENSCEMYVAYLVSNIKFSPFPGLVVALPICIILKTVIKMEPLKEIWKLCLEEEFS